MPQADSLLSGLSFVFGQQVESHDARVTGTEMSLYAQGRTMGVEQNELV